MRQSVTFILCFCLWGFARCQEFSIRTIELTADQVILHYDLVDSTRDRTYNVFVYSSKDNFISPLTAVSGDVSGIASLVVKPGLNKRIVWNAKEELGATFSGDVELEIRGRAYIPFVRFQGFEEARVRKRGVPFILKWTGGSVNNVLSFQLFDGDKLVHSFPNIPNEGETRLTLPTSIKPGENYYFRISDSKNSEQVVVTPTFEVKRKIPVLIKAIPVLAIGGLVYVLASGNSSAKELESPPAVPPTSN